MLLDWLHDEYTPVDLIDQVSKALAMLSGQTHLMASKGSTGLDCVVRLRSLEGTASYDKRLNSCAVEIARICSPTDPDELYGERGGEGSINERLMVPPAVTRKPAGNSTPVTLSRVLNKDKEAPPFERNTRIVACFAGDIVQIKVELKNCFGDIIEAPSRRTQWNVLLCPFGAADKKPSQTNGIRKARFLDVITVDDTTLFTFEIDKKTPVGEYRIEMFKLKQKLNWKGTLTLDPKYPQLGFMPLDPDVTTREKEYKVLAPEATKEVRIGHTVQLGWYDARLDREYREEFTVVDTSENTGYVTLDRPVGVDSDSKRIVSFYSLTWTSNEGGSHHHVFPKNIIYVQREVLPRTLSPRIRDQDCVFQPYETSDGPGSRLAAGGLKFFPWMDNDRRKNITLNGLLLKIVVEYRSPHHPNWTVGVINKAEVVGQGFVHKMDSEETPSTVKDGRRKDMNILLSQFVDHGLIRVGPSPRIAPKASVHL